jgi:hypothetical protein
MGTGSELEQNMPVILLWAGIPILLVAGGFVIYRIVEG